MLALRTASSASASSVANTLEQRGHGVPTTPCPRSSMSSSSRGTHTPRASLTTHALSRSALVMCEPTPSSVDTAL